ncbi:extracellular solute-binding protein [Cellulomonas triticagri]|uniref:Extracellular solute-binding protein n=1 Tax=Cellulomonas triticagri TaxID=2483352 RepID=A0A3M2JB64_9CELL|nr:extracellular solute-binding protein [Cellulomonas triticagri]RMI08753.1 extracellular solute-binding protein [Cellulomonas triticagri]
MRLTTRTAVAATAAALLLSSCALSGTSTETRDPLDAEGEITGEVSLQTWALKPRFTAYVEGVIAAFEDEYPGTSVTWLDQPGEGYAEKVLSQATAGELPDVTNLPPDMALPLAREGVLLDLDQVEDDLAGTYVEGGLGAYAFAGLEGTYGYPWYLTTDLNYWNADMLAAGGLDAADPPTDLDSLIDQARTLKDATGAYLMSRKPGMNDLVSAGIPVLSDDGDEFVFNSPEAVALVQRYVDAYAEGLLPQDVLTDAYLGNSELFTKGEAAWSTGGGNFIAGVLENNPSLEGKIVPSPYMGITPMYVQGVSVPADSGNLPAALALARFLTDAQNQEAFAELVPGIFPSTVASQDNPELAESDGTAEGDAKAIAFTGLPDAEVLQPVEVTEAMSTVFDQQVAAAIAGQVPAQQALDTAVERCNRLLAD